MGGVAGQSAASTAGFTNLDFGVDRQTTTFALGTAAAFAAGTGFTNNVTTFGTANLSETTTSAANPACVAPCLPAYVARAAVIDALGNDTIVFASTAGLATLSTGSAQTLGFDRTIPVVTSFTMNNTGAPTFRTYANNSVDKDDVDMVITVTFLDTAGTLNAGPSGFPSGTGPITGSTSAVVRFNAASPAGTGVGFTSLNCTTIGVSSTCTYTIPECNLADHSRLLREHHERNRRDGPGWQPECYNDHDVPRRRDCSGSRRCYSAFVDRWRRPVTFTADMNDNVELGDLLASVGYNLGYFAHQPAACTTGAVSCAPRQVLAAYGLPLTSAITGASVMYSPFIYSLESSTGANLPAGNQAVAQSINFAVRDMAGMVLRAPCPVPPTDNASFAVDSLLNGSLDGWCLQRQNNNVAVNIAFATPAPASFQQFNRPWSHGRSIRPALRTRQRQLRRQRRLAARSRSAQGPRVRRARS